MSKTPHQNQRTTTSPCGHIKILAPPFESCHKCGTMNTDDAGSLWRVVDERGMHFECDLCGTDSVN